jgi:thioredoxin-like negative regulator of GroEL
LTKAGARSPGLVLALLVAGCTRHAPVAAALSDASPSSSPIRFIENDYAAALAQARARDVPVFIDAWASWCHTCLSMRQFVFNDDRLRAVADRFVWLALDTERDESAPLVTRLGVKVLPTLFVVDSHDERVVLAWPGSLTAPELVTLLDDARTGSGPRGPLAVDAVVTKAQRDGRNAECAATAASEAPRMPAGTALADVVRSGIECVEDLPAGSPDRAPLAALAALGERIASDPSQPILADDRSDLYDYVLGAYRELGKGEDASRLAHGWVVFLEEQAARAPTPAARAVFDAHRLEAYEAIGEPGRAVPMLEQSEHDFPDDYNPPARLGSAYLQMKRYDDALAAVHRALSRAHGPRKLRIWSLEADVLVAMGNPSAARGAVREALDFAKTLALTGSYSRQVDALRARLAELSDAGARPIPP